jgi:hypothetical protein
MKFSMDGIILDVINEEIPGNGFLEIAFSTDFIS